MLTRAWQAGAVLFGLLLGGCGSGDGKYMGGGAAGVESWQGAAGARFAAGAAGAESSQGTAGARFAAGAAGLEATQGAAGAEVVGGAAGVGPSYGAAGAEVAGGAGAAQGECSGCLIDEACYPNGAQDPRSPCRLCDTSEDRKAWTSRDDGRTCGHGRCSAGACNCESGWANPLCDTCVIYVVAGKREHHNGNAWETAATTVYAGIEKAKSRTTDKDCEVWVAEGVYLPRDHYASFQLEPRVHLYGGFAGGETERSQRDWKRHETILSGDNEGNDHRGDPTLLRDDNSPHVVIGSDDATLDGFTISGGNADEGSGAGMLNVKASPRVSHCLFEDNTAAFGAAMYSESSSPRLFDVTFRRNVATISGGAMYNYRSSFGLVNGLFVGNRATFGDGGGVFSLESHITLTNASFASNTAAVGGAMYASDSTLSAVNCSLGGNAAERDGGGIYATDASTTDLTNCIVWDNDAPSAAQLGQGLGCQWNVTYSDIQGGWGSAKDHNVEVDPLFFHAPSGQLRLSEGSPCLDIGRNAALPADDADVDSDGNQEEPLALDLAGRARIADDDGDGNAIVDLGAYEGTRGSAQCTGCAKGGTCYEDGELNPELRCQVCDVGRSQVAWSAANEDATCGHGVCHAGACECEAGWGGTVCSKRCVVHVSNDGDDANDGATWNTAVASINTGLALADELWEQGRCEVWVKQGTYKPTDSSDRDATISLLEDVELYGGFAGVEQERSERDWEQHPTVLSGDLAGDDELDQQPPGDRPDNSRTIVLGADDSVLDGFTIRGAALYGMDNAYVSPSVANCTFTDSRIGMYNAEHASPVVADCMFRENSEDGIINTFFASPEITDCAFVGNSGSAVWSYGSSPRLSRCAFADNSSGSGGAIYNEDSPTIVEDCTFTGNAASKGGAIYVFSVSKGTTMRVEDCTFTENAASESGGAMYTSPMFGGLTIRGCAFTKNSAPQGGAIYNSTHGCLTIEHSGFTGNSASVGGALYEDRAAATIAGSTFTGNLASEDGAVAYVTNGVGASPILAAFTNCTFADNSSSSDAGGAFAEFDNACIDLVGCTFDGADGG